MNETAAGRDAIVAEVTKTHTVETVTERIQHVIEANDFGRNLKPGAIKLRAAALADLYEIRARLFMELDLSVLPAGQVAAFATAIATAERKDRESVIFWRNLAR